MNPFEAQAGLDFGFCDPPIMRKRPANHAKTTRQSCENDPPKHTGGFEW